MSIPAYTALATQDSGVPVVRLADSEHNIDAAIAPPLGNLAYELNVHGENILHFPAGMAEFQKDPRHAGIPFLAPWGNRLDQQAFWANGKRYAFDMELDNVRGGATPIHGLLGATPFWEVTSIEAGADGARVTARLEFWKHPDWMKQWPFAHEYEMTYALAEGELRVTVAVKNLSVEPMPVAIGFHPYFRIPGVPRDQWLARIPATRRVVTDSRMIPTGEYRPMDLPDPFPLANVTLDDGFVGLLRDPTGRARFSISGGGTKVEVIFGPKWQAAVVWVPDDGQGRPEPFVCLEPMAGITDAINLHQDGKYPELQLVAPGETWSESFWVRVRVSGGA